MLTVPMVTVFKTVQTVVTCMGDAVFFGRGMSVGVFFSLVIMFGGTGEHMHTII
jgi:hypothetical protein